MSPPPYPTQSIAHASATATATNNNKNNNNNNSSNNNSASESSNGGGTLSGLRQVVLCQKWTGAGKRRSTRQERGRLTVVLVRRSPDALIGLTLSGTRDGLTKISHLKACSVAERSDSLEENDVIISLNGNSQLTHNEIVSIIRENGVNVPLKLEIEYEYPTCTFSGNELVKTLEVYLSREQNDAGFGFVARNALFFYNTVSNDNHHHNHHHHQLSMLPQTNNKTQNSTNSINHVNAKNKRIYVTSVRPHGSADIEGSIKTGDRIVAVNGRSISDADELYAIMLSAISVRLLIEYDVETITCSPNGSALVVEIEKAVNVSIGVCVAQRWVNNRSVIIVDYIKPASIADRCGAIHAGDVLLSIDNHFLEGQNSIKEARRLLRATTLAENVKLEVASLPSCNTSGNLMSNIVPLRNVDQRHCLAHQTPVVSGCGGRGSIIGGLGNQLLPLAAAAPNNSNSMQQHPLVRAGCPKLARSMYDLTPGMMRFSSTSYKQRSATRLRSLDMLASPYAIVTHSCLMSSQICHSDSTTVCLQVDDSGNFGFTLQSSSPLTGILTASPIVGYVDPDGPAALCCVVQPGDRVVAVNGQCLEGHTLDEAKSLIKDSGYRVNLEIEFDVAESVSLSSGTFQVKLIKKVHDLGINVIYPKNAQLSEPPMIADVCKGSISYRSGMINAGDRLLAIDQYSILGKPVTEIQQILDNIAIGEIIRLKLRKDEYCTDDNLNEQGVTYTLEIKRQGGPLGITISAPDEPYEPVVVSGLSNGGLVERTNAIHIGDRILAINGISLRGKGLNEALKLLQCGQDPVTLKIFRPISKQSSIDKITMGEHQDNANSLDSALESWVGSHISDQRLSDQSPDDDQQSSINAKNSTATTSPALANPLPICSKKVTCEEETPFPAISEEAEIDFDSDGPYDNCL